MAGSLSNIEKLISEIPVLTDLQKKFYLALMKARYENVFQPVYQKIKEQQKLEGIQQDT